MENIIERIFKEDFEIHHDVYDRDIPLNLDINYKDEIISTYGNEIRFYSKNYNKQNEIKIEKIL